MGARDTDREKSERAGKCACVGREPEWIERGEADESEREQGGEKDAFSRGYASYQSIDRFAETKNPITLLHQSVCKDNVECNKCTF